jgi:hypothetical protein
MHRLTARLVLLCLLASIFAPAALAVAAPAPHACCMRKMHGRTSHEAVFDAVSCCQQDCCKSLTISQVGQTLAAVDFIGLSSQRWDRQSAFYYRVTSVSTAHSGRAPPVFFLS